MTAGVESYQDSSSARAKRPFVRILVTGLAVVAVLWLLLQVLGPYSRLRNRAKWLVGTERLQTWAIEAMRNPPPPAADGPDGAIDVDSLPDDIRKLVPHGFVVIVEAHNDIEGHILFAIGSGFYHYGLRVGGPTFEPWPDSQYNFEKLADGVWGQYER